METRESIQHVISEVSGIVSRMAGIQLGAKQSSMVENRLKTRMLRLGLEEFSDYLEHLKKNQESESQALLSLMTTHHTYFFREFSHFEFLLNRGLDLLIEKARATSDKKIRIWSAASSRGQEAYSLAMFFNFHLKAAAPDVTFEIWGTDIDPESVNHAKNGVYKAEELKQSPAMYMNGQWTRGTGQVRDFSKVKESLKKHVHFTTANLLSPEPFLQGKVFDIIFCRNVFIYFNQDQIKQCSKHMIKHLQPHGFFFLGVSESLNGLGLPVKSIGPSVYQHPVAESAKNSSQTAAPGAVAKSVQLPPPRDLDVLCVDDSTTILALLKKILGKDTGFNVKATAANGREALEKIKTQKFDLITLDLHMPELDGVGFLTESKSMDRPPVIIVSSINRDDPSIAKMAIDLGAADYVEKPSLENIAQAGNEIRSKLKMVWGMRSKPLIKPESVSASAPTASKSSPAAPAAVAKSAVTSQKASPATSPKLSSKKHKVLVVDDSQTIRQLLKVIISQDPGLEVCAEAEKPSQVEALIKQHKPDVITLDIHMPEMDGVTLLKKIHPLYKIPTVMISSLGKEEGPQVLQALESGAIDYIQKPQMSQLEEAAKMIREKIKVAATAKAHIGPRTRRRVSGTSKLDHQSLIVLGASTGGTEALRVVLESLPAQIPPILIVQHIPPVFSAAFANRLNDLCDFEVREARDNEEVKPNQVLIAPGGKQMGLKSEGGKLFVSVKDEQPVNRHKPSVDYLFKSVADLGMKKVVAAIFTGMGGDGAKMMKRLRDQGARTIAQNQETCVVFGMPKEAIAMGGAEFTLPLDSIAQKIMDLSVSDNKDKKAA